MQTPGGATAGTSLGWSSRPDGVRDSVANVEKRARILDLFGWLGQQDSPTTSPWKRITFHCFPQRAPLCRAGEGENFHFDSQEPVGSSISQEPGEDRVESELRYTVKDKVPMDRVS